MRLTVTARTRLDPALRTYAVEKLERLGRHDGKIHEARAVLEEDDRRVPRASAEVFVHLHHTQVKARCDGATLREAIDKVADKIDRQIINYKERVKQHKGHAAAGSDPLAPTPRHVEPLAAEPVGAVAVEEEPEPEISTRRLRLRPMSVADAVTAFEDGTQPFLLFLDAEGGELCLLTRGGDGELELIVADTR